MRENIRYVNHLGEEITTGEGIVYANENDLRDFEWNYKDKNGKITSFDRGIGQRTIHFIICGDEKDAYDKRNKIYEVFEKDVLTNRRGKLYIGDYYLECNVVKSVKSDYIKTKRCCMIKITVATEASKNFWIKEKTFNFTNSTEYYTGNYLEFPYDFPYDYTKNKRANTFNNDAVDTTDFELTIYGTCNEPYITISGNIYKLNCNLQTGEYAKINSLEKTIIKRDKLGVETNLFNLRDRENYIFEKMKPGRNTVSLSGNYSITLKLYQVRSEPKWT